MLTRAEDIWLTLIYGAYQRSVTDVHLNPVKDGLQVYERLYHGLSRSVLIDIKRH